MSETVSGSEKTGEASCVWVAHCTLADQAPAGGQAVGPCGGGRLRRQTDGADVAGEGDRPVQLEERDVVGVVGALPVQHQAHDGAPLRALVRTLLLVELVGAEHHRHRLLQIAEEGLAFDAGRNRRVDSLEAVRRRDAQLRRDERAAAGGRQAEHRDPRVVPVHGLLALHHAPALAGAQATLAAHRRLLKPYFRPQSRAPG